MKLSFICSIALLCLLCSCKKNKIPEPVIEPPSNLFSVKALAYVQLPLNRHFIYKDSASGTLDSVVVTQSILETKFQPAESGYDLYFPWHTAAYYYQSFTLLLTKYNASTPQDWFVGKATTQGGLAINSDSAQLSLVEIDTLNNIRVNNHAFFYPDDGSVLFIPPTIIPSLAIEGKSYSNVVFCSDSNSPDSTSAYYVKTENLVRYQ